MASAREIRDTSVSPSLLLGGKGLPFELVKAFRSVCPANTCPALYKHAVCLYLHLNIRFFVQVCVCDRVFFIVCPAQITWGGHRVPPKSKRRHERAPQSLASLVLLFYLRSGPSTAHSRRLDDGDSLSWAPGFCAKGAMGCLVRGVLASNLLTLPVWKLAERWVGHRPGRGFG